MLPTHVVAAELIRLLVIPYQTDLVSRKIPVKQFTTPIAPPPLLLRQQVERVESKGVDAKDGINDFDADWLVDG